jgi:hypothetical protein
MAKKVIKSSPVVYDPPGFTAEENEARFKRDYEFNTRAPQRSPVQGWEYKYINEGTSMAPPKEVALVKGTPHRFKHVRTGNIYSRRSAMKRSK